LTLDGVDVRDPPLSVLRSAVAVVPQDPVVLNGSIRMNLDPMVGYHAMP